MSTLPIDSNRKRELALIHMAKAQLGLTREDYEHVLRAVTGKTSAADLDAAGREKLLKRFKERGFLVKAKAGSARAAFIREPQVKKLLAMWYALADVGAVARPASVEACSRAVEAWGKEQLAGTPLGPLDALRFATGVQLDKLIESMKRWGERVNAVIR
jgi:phage gp16-like protein